MSTPGARDLTSTWGVDAFNNPGVARFRKQLDAQAWANDLVLTSIESIPLTAHSSPDYIRARQLVPHNQLARGAWLARIRASPIALPKDWFPAWTVEETRQVCAQNDKEWAGYLDQLKDVHLAKLVDYASSEGRVYRSSIEDVLIHVFDHESYHRGQIARLVSQCGGQRASTDFIAFSRLAL